MDIPKISIILPVFNGEKYLNPSIDSVLAQEYADYELLVCDDGSTDNSARIVESKQDTRIKLFKNITNQGLFKTINKLINQSRGEYIRLWSQDDVMKPNCIREEMEFYRNHPEIGFCYCAYDQIDESGEIILKTPEDKTPDIISSGLAAQIMFYHGSISGSISIVTIRKKVLNDVGLFCEDMKVANDFEMWIRISGKYPIGFIRQALIKLRLHSAQESRRKGAGLLFIRENWKNIAALIKRLPPEIIPYAKIYNRWHRHTQYVHYMFRSLLAGDFKLAINTYREIRKADSVLLAIGLWFFTVNGRLFRKKPRFML